MRRFLLTFIGILAIAISVNARTYTHTFKSGELKTDGGSVTLGSISFFENGETISKDIDWNASSADKITWNKSGRGIQIGDKNTKNKQYSLRTSVFAEKDIKIKSVEVYTSVAANGKTELTIKVGNNVSQAYPILESTDGSYIFTCDDKGDIEITWNTTERALYIKKIVVKYVLPVSMVDVEEVMFNIPANKIYENNTTLIAGVDPERITEIMADPDYDVVLYYTLDGTDPSYEDYNSDPQVGTTNSPRTCQMNPVLADSVGVYNYKIMIVETDCGEVYKSDIVEATFVTSPIKPYAQATAITNGNRYAFVANDSIADALVPNIANGFLEGRKTKKYEKYIESVAYSGFTFTAVSGGYTIQDEAGRYMYINGNDNQFYFASEKPATGAVWSISFKEDKAEIKNGGYTIYYIVDEDKFGCYTSAGAGMELPAVYLLREYPKATFSPEPNNEVKGLQEFFITCEEGISISSDFSLSVKGNEDKNGQYEINSTYQCEQIDKNTLKLTVKTPLKSEDNISVNVIITGEIYLNPDGIKYPIPRTDRWIKGCICSYTHKGDEAEIAAELLSVTPENSSTIEELSHFVFTFSKVGTEKSEDAELQPRLYAEGISWNYILENTQTDSDDKMIAMDQLALKTSEPILGNGTYILEIPTGCFIDRNGNNIEGITLKYTVKNDSGLPTDIEDIIEENNWTVYNINGVKVLETTNANDLNKLAKGVYIINGNKVIVK